MGTTISYPRPDGQIVQGYLAEAPHAATAPSLVVVQECLDQYWFDILFHFLFHHY